MNKVINISIVGVGGQGTLLSGELLCRVALLAGMDVKKSEVHGMAQRGGSVISQVKLGPKVYSPLIPEGGTDILVSFEKVEALRWAHLLKKDGVAMVNAQEIRPITVSTGAAQWPDELDKRLGDTFANLELIPALDMAQELGNAKCANVIMIGALAKHLYINPEIWRQAIRELVKPKFVDLNLKAFDASYNL
ncbi:MAG: indolepyruvate oxidoreductase subunit beta [Abditibacteriota bacterium]|nr:indolepyruvate oxidoreductase subunit beta [Abditibacteriota bacterium]